MAINKFSLASILILFNVLFLSAQIDKKYLAGAVPLVDGKVVFTRDIKVSNKVSEDKLLQLVEEWANKEYKAEKDSKRRVLLVDKTDSYIVCQGDEYLVFKSQVFMLDRTAISYHLVIRVEEGKCQLEFRNIKYTYQDYDDPMPAEKMITDDVALDKSGEKLNRHYDKFRTFTIDRVDELRISLLAFLGQISLEEAKQEVVKTSASIVDVVEELPQPVPSIKVEGSPAVSVALPVAVTEMTGYKKMSADKIEGIAAMLKDSWALVAIGNGNKEETMPAAWNGMGQFGGKPTSMSFVYENGNAIVDNGDTYTISFYTAIHRDALKYFEGKGTKQELTPIKTESGAAAFAEAWLIIECKKVLEQPATPSMTENAQSKKWNGSDYDKLYMGEIVNVWAR